MGQFRFDFQDPVSAGEQQLVDKQFGERAPVLVVDGGAKTGDQGVAVVGRIAGEPVLGQLTHPRPFGPPGAVQVSEGRLVLVGHVRVGPGDIVKERHAQNCRLAQGRTGIRTFRPADRPPPDPKRRKFATLPSVPPRVCLSRPGMLPHVHYLL